MQDRYQGLDQGLRLLCIFLLVLGIAFRFTNLDQKVYWHDEVYTSMEMTAHTRSGLVRSLFTGREITREELQKFQRFDPSHTIGQLWTSLGQEDPQHPPFHYLVGWHWIQVFGDSVASVRGLSVLFGLLGLGAMFWLCWELFRSEAIAWVSTALMAISPYHLLYAQEAREYSLWAALILVSSTLLLRSLRQPTWKNWALYCLSLTVALYTFLFTALVAIAHGIYVLFNGGVDSDRRFWVTRKGGAYLAASVLAVLALTPWTYYLIRYANVIAGATAWAKMPLPLDLMLKLTTLNFSRLWFDFDLKAEHGQAILLALPMLILEIYALYFVARKTPRPVGSFVLCLALVPILLLALPDALAGGQRSIVGRYLVPSFLGVHLAVAYLLTVQLQPLGTWIAQKNGAANGWFWRSLTLLVVVSGIASCTAVLQAETWWNKGISYHHPTLARFLNQSQDAFLVSDAFGMNPGNVVALSYLTEEKVKFFLLPEVGQMPIIPEISHPNPAIFVLNLPDFFREKLERSFGQKLTAIAPDFWTFPVQPQPVGQIQP